MSDVDVIPEKEDYKDVGPMGRYDDQNKPECSSCNRLTFVIATGKYGKWKWSCTNCVVDMEP